MPWLVHVISDSNILNWRRTWRRQSVVPLPYPLPTSAALFACPPPPFTCSHHAVSQLVGVFQWAVCERIKPSGPSSGLSVAVSATMSPLSVRRAGHTGRNSPVLCWHHPSARPQKLTRRSLTAARTLRSQLVARRPGLFSRETWSSCDHTIAGLGWGPVYVL